MVQMTREYQVSPGILVAPQLDLSSDEEGVRLAQNIWNLFLGGSGDRPFGPGVKLDGVDMMIRANGVTGYTKFAETMRSLMSANYPPSGMSSEK